jgi:hypothetical protein
VSSLCRGHANLLCIVPIFSYASPKGAIAIRRSWSWQLEIQILYGPRVRSLEPRDNVYQYMQRSRARTTPFTFSCFIFHQNQYYYTLILLPARILKVHSLIWQGRNGALSSSVGLLDFFESILLSCEESPCDRYQQARLTFLVCTLAPIIVAGILSPSDGAFDIKYVYRCPLFLKESIDARLCVSGIKATALVTVGLDRTLFLHGSIAASHHRHHMSLIGSTVYSNF